jgi:selenocysteine-specific elongation factor
MPPSGADATLPPLTLGTAGHIDHGKTVLVRALTGVDTDRLPAERERGISIELGFAPLELPSGRRVSVVDVPGHERFVRTMVAGATGVDLFLLVVAADDGVMPQTREHVRVLEALRVPAGVVAITKIDAAAADRVKAAVSEVNELLAGGPYSGTEIVPVSGRTGDGVEDLRARIDRVAGSLPGGSHEPGVPRLHVDRAFTLRGIGTVVTGTLWAGELAVGDRVRLQPGGAEHRIRSLQVHGHDVERAGAGQRVAVALTGADRHAVARGDVVTHPGAGLEGTHQIEVSLDTALDHGARVQVHHGTRQTPARVLHRHGRTRLMLEQPLVAAVGDRFVVRRIAPPDTIGGGVVEAVGGRQPAVGRGPQTAEGRAQTADGSLQPAGDPDLRAELLRKIREGRLEPPRIEGRDEQLELARLAKQGLVVRCGVDLFFDARVVERVRDEVTRLCERDGAVTIATLRDALGTSRRYAQALLERFDAERILVRIGDEHRLRRALKSPEVGRFR